MPPLYRPPHLRQPADTSSSSSQGSSSSQQRTQSAASTAFSTSQPPRLSQKNQARHRLNFSDLRKAEASNEPVGSLTPDSFQEMDHDEVIRIINAKAKRGIFLPLSYLHFAISKFTGERFGTLKEAIELFELAKAKHPREVSDKTLPDTIKLYSEMMWVYIVREDVLPTDHENTLMALYAECPATDTRDALMKYNNKIKRYASTFQLYNEWPPEITKGPYTLRYYLAAYKTTPGADVRKELRRLKEADPKMMEDTIFFVDFLANYFNRSANGYKSSELPELLQFFEEHPQHKRIDKSRRELLRAYIDVKDTASAEKCFHEWPAGEMTQQTLEVMINSMAQTNLEKAVDILGDFHPLLNSITIQRNTIKINLHNIKQSRHGSQRYGGDRDHLVVVKLWYLYSRILPKMKGKVSIEIITGQGTAFAMRTFVCQILDSTFKWPYTAKGGTIAISKEAAELLELNAQMPPRIDETTPLFIFPKREW